MTSPIGPTACWLCGTTNPAVQCCSAHRRDLCHACYRRTHFVEVCIEGCPKCANEGLPVVYPARP